MQVKPATCFVFGYLTVQPVIRLCHLILTRAEDDCSGNLLPSRGGRHAAIAMYSVETK